jgi:hypothetical protein
MVGKTIIEIPVTVQSKDLNRIVIDDELTFDPYGSFDLPDTIMAVFGNNAPAEYKIIWDSEVEGIVPSFRGVTYNIGAYVGNDTIGGEYSYCLRGKGYI